MEAMDKAELRNLLIMQKQDWQFVQKYIDSRIAEITQECIEYVLETDKNSLLVARGKLEALKEVRELSSIVT